MMAPELDLYVWALESKNGSKSLQCVVWAKYVRRRRYLFFSSTSRSREGNHTEINLQVALCKEPVDGEPLLLVISVTRQFVIVALYIPPSILLDWAMGLVKLL